MRPCAQVADGSPPETANTFRFLLFFFIQSTVIAAACRPSFFETWVKFESSLPADSTPTVNTGIPLAITFFVIAVKLKLSRGWIDKQSI